MRGEIRALALIGDFYHDPVAERSLLEMAAPLIAWSFATAPAEVDWTGLSAYGLVVVAKDDYVDPEGTRATWMSEAMAESLVAYVEAGGGLLAHHAGLASYPEESAYSRLVGGGFLFHPKEHPLYSVKPSGAPHPIMLGVEGLKLRDEMYFVRRDPAGTTLVATTASETYGSSAAVWCAARGKGRVACVTPGHRPEALANPGLARLVGNAAAWCAGER